MNSLERYVAVLEGRKPDILPRLPILMQFAAEHIGSDYGAFAADYNVLVEANRKCVEDFDMDQVSVISDAYRETQGFGAEIVYVTDGPPRCPHPPLAESRDISILQTPDPHAGRMGDRTNAVHALVKLFAGERSVLGWVEGPAAESADLRGVTTFLMDMMDDETFASELMEHCLATAIDYARVQIEAGADTVGIGDAIASQLSPAMYEELVLPLEQQLVDAIHAAGGRARLHICGDITRLLPGIASLGLDILDVDHMVDMEVARKAVGDSVTLAGNIDPVAGIRFGTPDAIRATIRDTYARAGAPYMVMAGCEVPSGTPVENLCALCEPVPA